MAALLAPYLYYGGKDAAFHFTGRKVTLPEHAMHLVIGVAIAGAAAATFLGRHEAFVRAFAVFLPAAAADEFIWHHGLPEIESDLHAKAHLALLAFMVVGLLWT